MISNIASFVLGLTLLVKGSDYFVKSAASIAKKMGVSEFIIGLTLVAIGTSIPELASSVAAALKQQSGLIIGNVVGSNITNIGLIVGLAATMHVIKTNREMLRRDGYIMLFAALLFYVSILMDKNISGFEGTVFLILYIGYVLFLFGLKPRFRGRFHFRDFITDFFGFGYLITKGKEALKSKEREDTEPDLKKEGLLKDLLIVIMSSIAIVLGANFLVEEAIFLSDFFEIPKTIIGISLIAIGTSLPELSVSISAARKGYGNIAVGNIIGSNIANIFLILGTSALISPISITETTLFYNGPFMILMSILLLVFIRSNWEIRRKEGAAFLILYASFMTALLIWGV